MRILTSAVFCFISVSPVLAQTINATSSTITRCDLHRNCAKSYSGGFVVKSITGENAIVSLSTSHNKKYLRLQISVTNKGVSPFDLVPSSLMAAEVGSKERILKYVAPEQIQRSMERRVAWGNALTAMAGSMQTQQVRTQSYSSGTVNAYGTGGYANASYSGTTTSTTTVPDYAAQARASAQIAVNQRMLSQAEANLNSNVLRSNTVGAGQTLSGVIYFEHLKKKNTNLVVRVPIGDSIYEIPFGDRE